MNQELWQECIEFHGHACPGLALGYKAAEYAAELLGFSLERTEDEELACVTENDACCVDCIQCLLSCTIGKGNLILKPRGKMAFSFFDRRTGKSVRLVSKGIELERGSREETIDFILNAPGDEIYMVKEPGFDVPEKAKNFQNKVCECCGETAREDMFRYQEGKLVCLDCFKEYRRIL